MKNQKVQFITTLVICVLVSSLVSVAATGNLFDSNEVTYDNTSSGMNSTNVKAAVDELYAAANDYSDINSRVQALENNAGDIFSIYGEENSSDIGLRIFDNNSKLRTILVHGRGNGVSSLASLDSTGTWNNFGQLNIYGNPVNLNAGSGFNITSNSVKINGTDYINASCTTKSSTNSNYTTAKLNVCRLGKIVQVFFEGTINYNNIPTGNNQSTNIFTGLPKSVTHVPLTLQIHSNAAPSQFGHVVFGVSPSGNLNINPGALPSSPGNYYTIFGGTYITTE